MFIQFGGFCFALGSSCGISFNCPFLLLEEVTAAPCGALPSSST